jgi:hypothetical protein
MSAAAAAQSSPATAVPARDWRYPGRLLGVYDAQSGSPIQDVEVTDVFNDVTVRTPASGLITLGFLPEGRSLVRVRKVGFTAETLFVSITLRDTAPITIVLNRLTDLAPVIITDSAPRYTSQRLRQFEQRRSLGIGHFVTEAELRKDDGRRLGAALMRLPGLMVTARNGSVVSTRGGCSPDVYVDGVMGGAPIAMATVRGGRHTYPGVGLLDVTDFAAIEYYTPGESPAQFRGVGNACGVIMLWTREK